ncbi:MAG: pro-sigmaK processing inhibitor BofA family protein [Oscillospiraceae bacterium]|nr:pro-sigmaK processing inhibitor BofA family protein [Oscillospiraceae bacterium]
MEDFLNIFIPVVLFFGFLRLCLVPLKWFWKLGLNSLCGFACLWLLNLISGYTGIFFPINLVTASIAGFLGIPGIILLWLVQYLL